MVVLVDVAVVVLDHDAEDDDDVVAVLCILLAHPSIHQQARGPANNLFVKLWHFHKVVKHDCINKQSRLRSTTKQQRNNNNKQQSCSWLFQRTKTTNNNQTTTKQQQPAILFMVVSTTLSRKSALAVGASRGFVAYCCYQ